MRAATGAPRVAALDHTPARAIGDDRVQAEDGHGRSKTKLRPTLADGRVPPRLDQTTLRSTTVPLPRPLESGHGSDLGLSKLQPGEMVRPKTDTASTPSVGSFRRRQKLCGRERCRKDEALQLNRRPSSLSHEKTISSRLPVPGFAFHKIVIALAAC